ncbi:MAG: plastocyanin domain-containing protein [Oleiphilaceae bacterium]|jgi:plastocyanin domain-containing protein
MMMFINLLGIVLIAAIVWWFWLPTTKNTDVGDGTETIIVENGVYVPSRISIASGKETSISFLRKDASPCASTLVFSDLDINEELVVDKIKKIRLPKLAAGTYSFGCQMQMYRGELVVI